MHIRDILQETYTALKANKARTGLTMLGIIIGIASVIAMTAIGNGAKQQVTESIESIGANLVTVSPGAVRSFGGPQGQRGSAKTLTIEDADAILKEVGHISYVVKVVNSQQQLVVPGNNTNTSIVGTEPSYSIARNIEISEGDFLSDQNIEKTSKVVVLGSAVRDDLFGEGATDIIGEMVRISGTEYKVVGIAKSSGGTGPMSSDDMVYIPYTTAQRYLTGDKYLSSIYISTESSDYSSTVQSEVETLLKKRHNIKEGGTNDFSTSNQADMIETVSEVIGTFTTFLAAVAAISLIVGGIGIMNMMLTTVTERTREIGLRKAIGAKKRDINNQFLIEATMLTLTGGVIGVILGWVIAFVLNYFGVVNTDVSIGSVFLSFGVSALIGIVFGYYPAHRAANLNPIDALRYE